VVIPTTAVARGEFGAGDLSRSFFQIFRDLDSPVVAALGEFGGSASTIAHTMRLVPVQKDYDYGLGYFWATTTIIPNVFAEVHPGVTHAAYSRWLTREIDPYAFRRGGGVGFSFIAEAYLNFGMIGALGFFMLLGFVWGKLVNWGDDASRPFRVVFIAAMLGGFLFWTRQEFIIVVRHVFWYAAIPCLVAYALARNMDASAAPDRDEGARA
jgi:oligosaccharide repeat unit polymerase